MSCFLISKFVAFHLGLGVFNGPADKFVLNGFAFVNAHAIHDGGDPFSAEDSQQIIFKGEIKPGRTFIPLAAGPTPELVVYSPGFVA